MVRKRFEDSACARNTSLAAFVLASTLALSAQADDIDVYTAIADKQQKPNILFVLDFSGSMNWDTSGVFRSTGNGPSRISVLKSAMNQILDNNVGKINAGLGPMFGNQSTGISWPISDLAADASDIDSAIPANQYTVSDILKQRIERRDAGGSTSTVDALVEAAQYFRGDLVTHSDTRVGDSNKHQPATWDNTRKRYRGGDDRASLAATYSPSDAWSKNDSDTFYCNDYSDSGGPNFCEQKVSFSCQKFSANDPATPGFELQNNLWGNYKRCEYNRRDTWETPRYNSPIADTCGSQNNAIVLITDGEPTKINKGASLNSLVGSFGACEDLEDTLFAGSEETKDEGNCGIEIIRALATDTVNPYLPDTQVKTYTVGFNINGFGQNYLERLGAAGKGGSFNAETPAELNEALAAIVDDISIGSENFAELSVDVDKASFSHNDRVYYSFFSPSIRRSWKGNLKGYFVDGEGLKDINGNKAINGSQFADKTQSFWSSSPDGNKVDEGGASGKLLDGNRNLYTFLGDQIPVNGIRLSGQAQTRLQASNAEITNAMLGLNNTVTGTNARNASLNWIQSAPMGDPLHTRSVGVNYGDLQVVYVMTNQGLLHAFNATKPIAKDVGDDSGGEELFAFMPKRLLTNLNDSRTNLTTGGHIYGLDGAMTRWHDDTNNNGIVDTGESVMLYFGMRRGGSAYYAMDVSNPKAPTLKWMIDDQTKGFEQLGQSWSKMSVINVSYQGREQRVLAFAGGYDATAQDDVNAPVASKGGAIYMVSEAGELLWSIDGSNDANMQYSIPSDLALIDSDGDLLADRLYVGDLGGQLWRVDFDDIAQPPSITRFANLADQHHQPFFYPPSVALNGTRGSRFLSITVGSGNRTDPLLKDVTNNFYMIRDIDIEKGKPSNSFTMITPSALYDATNNAIQSDDSSDASAARTALDAARGWHIQLPDNEKSLSGVLTYEGKILATTYKPNGEMSDDICGFESTGVLYIVDVNDASVVKKSADSTAQTTTGGSHTNNDQPRYKRTRSLKTQGIPSRPVPLLAKGTGSVQIFVDKESVDEFSRTLSRVYWHAR